MVVHLTMLTCVASMFACVNGARCMTSRLLQVTGHGKPATDARGPETNTHVHTVTSAVSWCFQYKSTADPSSLIISLLFTHQQRQQQQSHEHFVPNRPTSELHQTTWLHPPTPTPLLTLFTSRHYVGELELKRERAELLMQSRYANKPWAWRGGRGGRGALFYWCS